MIRNLTGQFDLSFIISVYNRLELTRPCIQSLFSTVRNVPYEIIVVDDHSTDGTVEFLKGLAEPHQVVLNDIRRGYAVNNNKAAEMARGKLLCLLNNDTILTPGWLEPMLRAFELYPRAGIIGNVQINARTGKFDHFGVTFSPRGEPSHYGQMSHAVPRKRYMEWPAVTAACCLIKRNVFLEANGFDEGFRNGFEDVDLCLRLLKRGYLHYVANRSVIYHYLSSSEGRFDYEVQNVQRFMQKWGGESPILNRIYPNRECEQGFKYLRKYSSRPWRYKIPKLYRALSEVVPFMVQRKVYQLQKLRHSRQMDESANFMK